VESRYLSRRGTFALLDHNTPPYGREMKRLSNALRIADIEYVLDAPASVTGSVSWVAHGAHCERHRHQYAGIDHAFTFDVVHLKYRHGRNLWHAAIITESWRFPQISNQPRTTKSIKLLQGRSSDILDWIKQARAAKLEAASKS
jgi:hypothetical protein